MRARLGARPGRGAFPASPPGAGGHEEATRLKDHDAFIVFVRRHYVELARWAYVLTGSRETAEDVTMETFEAVWRQWPAVSGARSPLSYTRRILVRRASALWRVRDRDTEHRYVLSSRFAGEPLPWEDAVADRLDMLALIDRLPERKRLCILLRYGFDLGEQEVADVLGVTVGTVKSQTAKALQQIRDEALSPAERP